MTYNEAAKRLEEIVKNMEENEIDIDALQTQLKEAQVLIRFCKDKLYKADEEIKKLLQTEEAGNKEN